ncbi:L,D-transpeptidase family protein [Sphingomonas piscis]
MRYGDFIWNDQGIPSGPTSVRVDLRTQLLSVFRGGHEIGTSVILYGADTKETPLGQYPVLWKGKDHRSSLYDAPMPYTLRLTGDGVAIHGSDVRWGAATHGCIGVPTDFARRLFSEVSVGEPVVILRSVATSERLKANKIFTF